MQEGTVLRNNYRLERMLGRGGMADVYLAFDTRRQVYVAVKILREDLAEDLDFVRRFAREAEALARLEHPNIVRFYSFERQGATAFIVMDYVPGTSLQRRLSEADWQLPLDETTRILRQVGAALQYAHNEGYIHRDIKPGNIMLRDDGSALLSDFGIARAAESATLMTATMGTPAYMSPEQILGHDPDRRADIYAFGVVLYELVAGRRPFTGDERGVTGTGTLARLREAHLRLNPPDPRSFNPALPPGIAQVILQALAKNPDHRWPDVTSMIQAWDAAITRIGAATAPAAAEPATAPARTPTPPQRTPTPVSAPPPPYTPPQSTPYPPTPAGPAPARPKSTFPLLAAAGAFGLLGIAIIAWLAWRILAPTTPDATPTIAALAPSPTLNVELTAQALAASYAKATAQAESTVNALVNERSRGTAEAIAKTATDMARALPSVSVPTLAVPTVGKLVSTPEPTATSRPPTKAPLPTDTPEPTSTPALTSTPKPAPPATSTPKPRPASTCPGWFVMPEPGKGLLVVENHIGKEMLLQRVDTTEDWRLPPKEGETPGRAVLQLPAGSYQFRTSIPGFGRGRITLTIGPGQMFVSPCWFNDREDEFVYPLQPPPGC